MLLEQPLKAYLRHSHRGAWQRVRDDIKVLYPTITANRYRSDRLIHWALFPAARKAGLHYPSFHKIQYSLPSCPRIANSEWPALNDSA